MLITKVLLPRRREDVLTRQRLLNRLYDMVDYKLVLVSAPAGYGKSTLLVDFATDLEHPVCWYALDGSDRDPYLFVQRLVMSIRRRFPEFGAGTLRALEAGGDLRNGAPGIVRVLINEIITQIPRWFVIVLDDYHALGKSPEVDALLSNFVASQGDQCLTIIASRTVPNLPLIIPLVARGGVGGIGQDEVRFTPTEIQELFARNYDTELTQLEANALAEQSEGWITGLLLTAYQRLQGVLQSWMQARSSREPVYDYLAQEVFDRQSGSMQDFLLVTSTLTEMTAELCADILGVQGAAEALEAVEARNLFVARLEGGWFRYHHLFRDFLQTHLQNQNPERWRSLHQGAAAWYEAHGQPLAAGSHYMLLSAYDEAARLMAGIVRDLYVSGRLTTLLTWHEQLPPDVLSRHPRLALFLSRAAYKIGDRDPAMALAEAAEAGYQVLGDDEGQAYAQLHRCEILLARGELRAALALGQEALVTIETTGVPVAYEAHRILGRTYVRLGDLTKGYEHLSLALTFSRHQGAEYDVALIQAGLAQCLGRLGRFGEAVELNRESVSVWRHLGSDAALAEGLNDLGFHLYSLGDYEEAIGPLQEALVLSQDRGLREVEAVALVNLGELARDLGLDDQALEFLERGRRLAKEIGDRFLVAYSTEALGLVYRGQKRYGEARDALRSAIAAAEQQGSDYQLGRYRASLGAVMVASGAVREGLDEIALALATMGHMAQSADLYRARLLRAWVLYTLDQKDAALDQLAGLLDRVPAASEAQVFVVEGRYVAPLYSLARKAFEAQPSRAHRLRQIARRVKQLATTGQRLFPQGMTEPTAGGSELRVYGFGAGRVELDGEEVSSSSWGSVAARHLLFYMLIHGSRTREQIFDDFWPDQTAQKAKASFHTTKFRLHHAIGQDVIEFDGRTYALHPDLKAWFDVASFRSYLFAWQSSQDVDTLVAATDLYKGDFLIDCYMDWCDEEREALRVRCLEALETLAGRLLARRQYRQAAHTLRQALELEPAREIFHQQLMRAFALSGRRSRALAQYEMCRSALQHELDADPSQATRELYDRILKELPLD